MDTLNAPRGTLGKKTFDPTWIVGINMEVMIRKLNGGGDIDCIVVREGGVEQKE